MNCLSKLCRPSAPLLASLLALGLMVPLASPVLAEESLSGDNPGVSVGEQYGLRRVGDALGLHSTVALVQDIDTGDVLFAKNEHAVLPIASITKLMTALVVLEAGQSMSARLRISNEDIDTYKNTRSRLTVGSEFSRAELLHLALMSSENRAAHALGRYYPGGMSAMIQAMNAKAQLLGMHETRFAEPTGLSSRNISSARDLVKLLHAAADYPEIRRYSTRVDHLVQVGGRAQQFRNSNALVRQGVWDIQLSKTGFTREAGRCLVMLAEIEGRRIAMVLLDANRPSERLEDAQKLRRLVESVSPTSPMRQVIHSPAPAKSGSLS